MVGRYGIFGQGEQRIANGMNVVGITGLPLLVGRALGVLYYEVEFNVSRWDERRKMVCF